MKSDQGGRPQRQDSLEDQMRDVMMLAIRMHLTLEQKQRGYVDLENGRTV